MSDQLPIEVDTLAETERYTIWRAREPDGEIQYHVDMENVTLHFFEEEWREFVRVIQSTAGGTTSSAPGKHRKK